MLSCVIVFGLLLGGICGCGLGLGLLMHWLLPAIDRGMATLCSLVATGVALLAFGQLMTFTEPAELARLLDALFPAAELTVRRVATSHMIGVKKRSGMLPARVGSWPVSGPDNQT